MRERIRTVRLAPYLKGQGPTFTLHLFDTGTYYSRGCTRLGYQLKEGRRVLFEGSDFCGSPLHADDSDATVAALLTFLTLRPGDTDADYFADYTPAQHAFAAEHAEHLSVAAMDRFGDA